MIPDPTTLAAVFERERQEQTRTAMPDPTAKTILNALRAILDLLFSFGVAQEVLQGELDAAAVRRANALADAAEAAKGLR